MSLILTKEMLLVAKKPSYKTMYTLKFAAGLKAFTVSLDSWSLVWRFVAELVGLFDCSIVSKTFLLDACFLVTPAACWRLKCRFHPTSPPITTLRLQGYKTMGDDTGNLHANRCQKIPTV